MGVINPGKILLQSWSVSWSLMSTRYPQVFWSSHAENFMQWKLWAWAGSELLHPYRVRRCRTPAHRAARSCCWLLFLYLEQPIEVAGLYFLRPVLAFWDWILLFTEVLLFFWVMIAVSLCLSRIFQDISSSYVPSCLCRIHSVFPKSIWGSQTCSIFYCECFSRHLPLLVFSPS